MFFVFDDLFNFEDYQSGMLQNIPQMRVFYFFFPSGLNYYMCVFGKTAEVKCHFHQISRVHAICMTVDINHLARVAFASFSTFLPLFPYRTFGKKVVMHSPHLEQGSMFSVFKNGVSA